MFSDTKTIAPIIEIVFREGLPTPSSESDLTIKKAEEAYLLVKHLARKTQEELWSIHLDDQFRVIGRQMIVRGERNRTTSSLSDIFRGLIASGASHFFLAHNHPCGDCAAKPEPSENDVDMTMRIYRLGHMLQVNLLDHIVVGSHGYTSIREQVEKGEAKAPDEAQEIINILPLPPEIAEILKRLIK